MSGHRIQWTFDRDEVVGKVICEEPEGANCRLTGGPECYCEEPDGYYWCYCEDYHIERDPDGTPFHVYEGERHSNIPMDGCNIVMSLDEDLLELGPREEFVIGSTPIAPVWDGDGYYWKRAES